MRNALFSNIRHSITAFVVDKNEVIIHAANLDNIGLNDFVAPATYNQLFHESVASEIAHAVKQVFTKNKKKIELHIQLLINGKAIWHVFTIKQQQIDFETLAIVMVKKMNAQQVKIIHLQNQLKQTKEQLKTIKQISDFNAEVINNANAIIIALNKHGEIIRFSKNAEQIAGYVKEEVLGKNALQIFVPKNIFPNEHAFLMQLIKTGQKGSFYEGPLLTKSGETKIITWKNRNIQSSNNVDIAFVCIGKDITELRANTQRLSDSEARFRELAKTLPLAIICIERSGKIAFINAAYTKLFGYNADELKSVNDIIQTFYESDTVIQKAKQRWQFDLLTKPYEPIQPRIIHVRCKNGAYKDIEVNGSVNNENLYYSYTDLTYRLQYEKDLIQGKEYFKNVAENTPIPVAIGNLKMETVFVNKAFTKVLGYTLDDIPKVQNGNPYFVFKDEEESQQQTQEWLEIANTYINTGKLLKQIIYRTIRCKDNSIKHFEINFSIDNQFLYSNFIDITEKKKVEQLLIESEQKFKKVAENIPLPMVCHTKEMEFIFTNQQFTEVFGLSMNNINSYGLWLSKFVYSTAEIEKKETTELFDAIANFQKNTTKVSPILERRIKDKHNNTRVFEIAFTVQEDLIYALLNDVTEKIQTKRLLQKSELRFKNIAENAPLAIITFDFQMNITYVNKQFKRLLGYSLEDVAAYDVWQKSIVHVTEEERFENEKEWLESVNRLRAGNLLQAESLERTIICKNGENRIFEISFTADDKLVYAILDDITERKTSELRLFESEQRFKALADNMPIAIGSHHINGTVLFLNNHFLKTIGYTLQDIPTLEDWYLKTQPNPDIRATLFAHWLETVEAYRNNQLSDIPHIETDIRCKDKITRTFNFLFSIHQDIVYIMLVDITERRKAEKELISSHLQLRELTSHLQKVREEERKYIAREIHDELGQLITGLKMDISMLKRRLSNKIPDIGNYMVDVLDLTDTIVNTVRRIASDLRPSILDDIGLGAALEWQAKEFEKRTAIKCVFDNQIDHLDLSVDIKSNLFRIYQESLTNIIRHSNATSVHSIAKVIQKKMILKIVDNGRGFDTHLTNKTLGILGMKERAIMINATFTIESETNVGTTITIKMPLN